MHGRDEKRIKNFGRKDPKGRPGCKWELEWMLKKQGGKAWTGFI
jgi:hypothetical protein